MVQSLSNSSQPSLTLRIIPPSDHHLPPALLVHSLDRPSQQLQSSRAGVSNNSSDRHQVRPPPAFAKSRKALANLKLDLPHTLLADRTIWWSLVVEQVEFDLVAEEVKVVLVDGSVERWELAELVPRTGLNTGNERGLMASELSLASSKREFVATQPFLPPSRPDGTVCAQLTELTRELRGAYEDLSLSSTLDSQAPDISSDEDFELLSQLAADPSLPLPDAWDAKPDSQAIATVPDWLATSSDPPPCPAILRDNSPGLTLPASEDDAPAASDELRFHDQLVYRKRPRSLAELHASESTDSHDPLRRHDFLSLIEIVSRTRHALLDLFALRLVPLLRERLGAASYPICAAASAARWCRRLARQKGAEVSRLVLRLLDDEEGDEFDGSDESDGSEVGDSPIERAEADWLGAFADAPSSDSEERRERRRQRNVFHVMRDDFELRLWCQRSVMPSSRKAEHLALAHADPSTNNVGQGQLTPLRRLVCRAGRA